ncbi:MAG: hypothetical protein WCF85_17620, partial [Rhodospirillaceae bacterium]
WTQRLQIPGQPRVREILHPYDILRAFRTLPQLPKTMAKESKFLELILALVLRQYVLQQCEVIGKRFSFDSTAREYFLQANLYERQVRNIADKEARFEAVQKLHDCLYHGMNYYIFSIIAKEKSPNDGKMFALYCHAAYSLARIDRDGSIHERPIARRLTTKSEVLFLFRQDRGLQARCRADSGFRAQIKSLLGLFRD